MNMETSMTLKRIENTSIIINDIFRKLGKDIGFMMPGQKIKITEKQEKVLWKLKV